jgi:hypothetical protein
LIQEPTKIFKIAPKESVVCPPEQVFVNPNYVFLFTLGGHLVDDENEYINFISLLKKLGEKEFYLLENLGATLTERQYPFHLAISVDSSYQDFDTKLKR